VDAGAGGGGSNCGGMSGARRLLSAMLAVLISKHQFFWFSEPPGVTSALRKVV
jgi:hypothetical protein